MPSPYAATAAANSAVTAESAALTRARQHIHEVMVDE